LKNFLETVNEKLENISLPNYSEWKNKIIEWEKQYKDNMILEKNYLDPVQFVRDLSTLLEEDAIMTSDVGQNQMWVAQGVKIQKRQRLLNSSGFGSMGYSLPAAIGAKIACPNTQVIAFMGDGGLQMNVQELLLLSQRKINIKCIVFNNNTLGMMKDLQRLYYKERYYGATPEYFNCVNLKLLSKAFGIEYIRIKTNNEIKKLKTILKDPKSYLIDLQINCDSKVLTRYDELKVFEENII
jgi:acetolactate synthase-1/2/3 large subunit